MHGDDDEARRPRRGLVEKASALPGGGLLDGSCGLGAGLAAGDVAPHFTFARRRRILSKLRSMSCVQEKRDRSVSVGATSAVNCLARLGLS